MLAPLLLTLLVSRGPGPGEVVLAWNEGAGPFEVKRAPAAALVDDPGAHLHNTSEETLTDAGGPAIAYYRIVPTACGNGQLDFGEECDDGAHAGGDGCTPRCTRETSASCVIASPVASVLEATGSLWGDAALFWKLDESGDAARVDAVSGLPLYSDPDAAGTVAVPAKVGLGQHIDGPNLYHFYRSTSSLLDHHRGSFTWVAWARLDSTYDDQTIVGKWSIPENQREYRVQYNKATGLVAFDVAAHGVDGACEIGHVAHPTLLETGRFYFVEAWHDASGATIGVRVSTEAMRGPAATAPWAAGVHMGWGDLNVGAHNTCLDDHFHGTLDAVGFWKRLLSEDESVTLWNGGQGLEIPSSAIDSAPR